MHDYSFVLAADDYVALNRALCRGPRAFAPYGWLLGFPIATLVFWAAYAGSRASMQFALVIAFVVLLLTVVLVPPVLWWRAQRSWRRYYSTPATAPLLGPHQLSLREDGLESTGPNHRSWRAWPTVCHITEARDHLLLSTVYGNVYLLPWHAVSDRDALLSFVRAHIKAEA